jgi:alpha-L-arabinofuranosidase
MIKTIVGVCVVSVSLGLGRNCNAQTGPLTISVDLSQPGKRISPDLTGIFFEDINYAADGGLYAELIQNRSFEYSPVERNDWNPLTSWEQVSRGGARGSLKVMAAAPLHPNNPHYLAIETQEPGDGFGLMNSGFDGIAIRADEPYDFSVFARQLFTGNRWGNGNLTGPARLIVRLETKSGELLAEKILEIAGRDWQRFTAPLVSKKSEDAARLVLLCPTRGAIAVDMVSLFPRNTFKHHPNGLRADLAQVIADLKPKFMRFPGGCLVHGDGLGNIYRWQDTVGPIEQRRGQPNLWGYHQSVGLGYFEFFQFCEDIGAKPLPVVAAGVCCQNADHQGGTGQRGFSMDAMPGYIQDVMDLIEWANGPVTSKWGAVRAAAGHPEPFHLQYLGVGNEDQITPVFRERFKMIFQALKEKHPEITVVGTVGPFPDGEDFERGWKFADELGVPMVDEHYYQSPQWFWQNLHRYDAYDRAKSKVYVGEYAAHDDRRRSTLRSALAEAAHLTSLERNADVVSFASYAPLLAKRGNTQWNPNLIYFSNTQVAPTINYYVQQLFSVNNGDVLLSTSVRNREPDQAAPKPGDKIFLGAWDTQVEFDDLRVNDASGQEVDETFTGSAKNWRSESGKWRVGEQRYQQTGKAEPAISRLQNFSGGSHYTLTLRARKTGGTEGFLIGFRALDSANYFWWNIGGWGNTRDVVEKSVNGVRSVVGDDKAGSVELNRWYDIRIEVAGERIRCFLNDELKHDFTDAGFAEATRFAFSSVRDTKNGDVILKFVNGDAASKSLRVELNGANALSGSATKTVLANDDPDVVNDFQNPRTVVPVSENIAIGNSFDYTAPAHSLTILRIH